MDHNRAFLEDERVRFIGEKVMSITN